MMKKQMYQFLQLLVFLFVIQPAFAQEQYNTSVGDKKNIFKLNMVSPVLSSLSLAYERVINPAQSFQVSIFVQNQNSDAGYYYADKLVGFGIIPELRYYLSERKDAPAGFFIAPFLSYRHYAADYQDYDYNSQTYTDRSATFDGIGVGITVGGQWIFKKRISLDVWGGTGFGFGFTNEKADASDPYEYLYFSEFPYQEGGAFLARGGVTVGFLF